MMLILDMIDSPVLEETGHPFPFLSTHFRCRHDQTIDDEWKVQLLLLSGRNCS